MKEPLFLPTQEEPVDLLCSFDDLPDKLINLTIGQAIYYSSIGYSTEREAWKGMGNKLLLIEDWKATDWIAYKEE